MNGMPFGEVSFKRTDQIRTLAHVVNSANCANSKKHISSVDPTVLFNRLLVIMQRSPDMKVYFGYELSQQPMSLFKDNYMRKADKSQLAKELRKGCKSEVVPIGASRAVVDGGYLLRAVVWKYGDICQQYVDYVGKHYGGSAVIVFDGYGNGPSTKDHEHKRRATRRAPSIAVDPQNVASHDQSSFLCNETNKSAFVAMLTSRLQYSSYSVHQAVNDADTKVVKIALQYAASEVVNVIANDTDILVMLLYHYRCHMQDVYMSTGSDRFVYSIPAVSISLGSAVQHLLAIHAISGCDTTSSLFGHGKVGIFKKFSQSAVDVHTYLAALESPSSSHELVMDVGQRLLTLLYGGSTTDSLNGLRYRVYMQATAQNSQVPKPEKLPPTDSAARFSHLQAVQWNLLSTSCLNPQNWGWKLHNDSYVPVTSDMPAHCTA